MMNAMSASVRVTPIAASRNAKPSEMIAARIHTVSLDISLLGYRGIYLILVRLSDKQNILLSYIIPQDGSTFRT